MSEARGRLKQYLNNNVIPFLIVIDIFIMINIGNLKEAPTGNCLLYFHREFLNYKHKIIPLILYH